MTALVGLWSHALAALLYAGLMVWHARQRGSAQFNPLLLVAFACVSIWALFQALDGPQGIGASLAESVRNLAFLCFMYGMIRHAADDKLQRAVKWVYAAIAAIIGLQIIFAGLSALLGGLLGGASAFEAVLTSSKSSLGVIAAAGSLVLLHNLYGQASPNSRGALQLPVIALAAIWAYDLHLYTFAYLTGDMDNALFALRGGVVALLAPLFALASSRNSSWQIKLSRRATFQSISIIAILFYFILMMAGSRAIGAAGGEWVSMARLGLIAAMTIAGLFLLLSAKGARAWLRVIVSKHFFEHRYDYREDWLRFTRAVGGAGEGGRPLGERVVKALADMAGSPGGLLLMADEHHCLAPAARWNWPHRTDPAGAASLELVRFLETTAYVIDFGAHSDQVIRRKDLKARIPGWFAHDGAAWAGIPLVHNERLVGLVLLDHPQPRRPMDWEDYDLFRTAGIQAASYFAEARGQAALADAQRFDEFNRRFAFIMHDIKNLVSQLSLVARNAERHADNPEFRADMISTLQNSVKKMNDLLARLSRETSSEAQPPRALLVQPIITRIAEAKRQTHPIEIQGDAQVLAMADPARLEQALGHLVQNAIDASPEGVAVRISSRLVGGETAIEIVDAGEGMSDEFIRGSLFQPFASTKPNGFGVGAFEARTLVAAMGGRIHVASRQGEGSRFTIYLPAGTVAAKGQEERKIA
ncbi:MAG: PEP-CTERM system histidine kinase PrsK [Sphingosinicella sp.]|nr:PEP-CTERM system histidine kinase PrsK [Sphingosinicella sp.]